MYGLEQRGLYSKYLTELYENAHVTRFLASTW